MIYARTAMGAILAMAGSAFGQNDAFWTNPEGGLWFDSSNWSGGVVPNNAGENLFNAVLDLQDQAYMVFLDMDAEVENFSLLWGGAMFDLGSSSLTVNQDMIIRRGTVLGAGTGGATVGGDLLLDDAYLMYGGTITSLGVTVIASTGGTIVCSTGVDHRGPVMRIEGAGPLTIDQGGSISNGSMSTLTIAPVGQKVITGDDTGTLQNDGVMINGDTSRGLSGATTLDGVNFINNGSVIVDSGALILNSTNNLAPDNVLSQGAWTVRNGSLLSLGDAVIEQLNTEVTISGANSSFENIAPLRQVLSSGRFAVEAGQVFETEGDLAVESGARIRVGDDSALKITGGLLAGQGGSLQNGSYEIAGVLSAQNLNITEIATEVTLIGPHSQVLNANGSNALAGLNLIGRTGELRLRDGRSLAGLQSLTVENLLSIDGANRPQIDGDRVLGPGTLQVGGSLIFTETSTLELLINGEDDGLYGRIIAGTTEVFEGATLSLIVDPAAGLVFGDEFLLLDTTSLEGRFTNLLTSGLDAGLFFDIQQTDSGIFARVVPTPGAAGLLVCLGLVSTRRRR